MRRTIPALVCFYSRTSSLPPYGLLLFPLLMRRPSPRPPALGDPGKLVSIALDSGRTKDGLLMLSGRDAVQQLVITGDV